LLLRAANTQADIISLTIIDSSEVSSPSSVICFLENGTVLAVDHIPIDDLCVASTPQALASLMQHFKFSKYSTPYQAPLKTLIVSLEGHLLGMLIDERASLHLLDFGSPSSVVVSKTFTFPDSVRYVDLTLVSEPSRSSSCFPVPTPGLVLTLTALQEVSLFDLTRRETLCSVCLGGLVSPLVTNLNTFLMTSSFHTSPPSSTCYSDPSVPVPMPCILFSLMSLVDEGDEGEGEEEEMDRGIHSYLLIDGHHFLHLDTTLLPSHDSPHAPSYAIGSFNSSSTSHLFATWTGQQSETLVLSYASDMIESLGERIASASSALSEQLSGCDDVPTARDLTLEDDSASLIGYLLQPLLPFYLISHLQQNLRGLSSEEILLLLKLVFQNSSCPGDRYVDLLLASQQLLEHDPQASNENLEELQIFVDALLTTLECDWSVTATSTSAVTNASQATVMKRLFEEEGEGEEGPEQDQLIPHQLSLSFSSLIGKKISAQTWEQCLRKGSLNASSVILRRHLQHTLPLSPDRVIRMVNLEACSMCDFIDWIHRDILPPLHALAIVDSKPPSPLVEVICEDLITTVLATEVKDGHPYNSILLSELTLHIASSLLMSSSEAGKELLHRIQAIHSAMSLQAAIWTEWDEHLTYQDIVNGQLNGILSRRLRNLSITNPCDDIRTKIRPLMRRFHEATVSFDQMLYEWVVHTVQTSVILVMESEPDQRRGGGGSDNPSQEAIHIKRLVAVAEGIEVPNHQAQAIICLLQTLSLPHITSSLESYAPPQSDESSSSSVVSNEEMINGLYRQLHSLSCHLEGKVSSSIADALSEAFRSYELRQLAIRYRIRGFNPREPKQVRDAISLILSKIHISSSISDAIRFAEGYSTSGVDLSHILVKAMIHRIIPLSPSLLNTATEPLVVNPDASQEKDNLLRSSLLCIPCDRLQVVVEDTCSYLLSLMSDFSSESIDQGIVAGRLDPTLQESFSSCATGALLMANFFLDQAATGSNDNGNGGVSESHGLSSVDHPQVSSSSDPSREHASMKKTLSANLLASPLITPELQNSLKRIKKLILEFSLHLCPHQMNDPKVCHDILTRTALASTEDIILGLNEGDSPPVGNTELLRLWTPQFLRLRKLCLLLNGSYVLLLSSMMKHCLVKGYMVAPSPFLSLSCAHTMQELGMCFAEMIAIERKDVSHSHSTVEGMGRSKGNSNNNFPSQSLINESEVVINAAVTLCGVAAKKVTPLPLLPMTL
jgi:hypothetical protein